MAGVDRVLSQVPGTHVVKFSCTNKKGVAATKMEREVVSTKGSRNKNQPVIHMNPPLVTSQHTIFFP
jgi:hypothetical protein